MHPYPLLDPMLWDDVAARQQQLLDAASVTRPPRHTGAAEARGDHPSASANLGSADLRREPESAQTPKQLRAT